LPHKRNAAKACHNGPGGNPWDSPIPESSAHRNAAGLKSHAFDAEVDLRWESAHKPSILSKTGGATRAVGAPFVMAGRPRVAICSGADHDVNFAGTMNSPDAAP